MVVAKGIGAAARLNIGIGDYGSRLKAGTRVFTPVIVRLDRTIQYAAALRFISGVSGILVRPVSRAMTARARRALAAVIASEAKQSMEQQEIMDSSKKDGLLRRKGSSQ
jgi:hypothetical protein